MYTNGEDGSNLQAFSNLPWEMWEPGETVEAEVEGDGSIFDSAEYQGGTGESAGHWFDWGSVVLDRRAPS
jgi:hypothetical protein